MNQEESNKKDRIFKIFKLSLGETIICIVLKETTSYVEIQFPFRLNMMHTPHGTINLALSRWDHTIDYNESIRLYKNSIVAVGDTTDHEVQTRVLSSYGISSRFSYTLNFNDLNAEILAQRPVVIGILHRGSLSAPTGGHMIVVIGVTLSGDYVVNDPYGSLNDGYTSEVSNGKGAIYTRKVLERRWCPGGNDGWGRIFDVKK